MKKLIWIYILCCICACGGGDKNEGNIKTEEQGETINTENREEKIKAIISNYCNILNSGNYKNISLVFADQVSQYITMKNTNPDAIATEVNRFLSTKKQVKYSADMTKLNIEHNIATVPITMNWEGYESKVQVKINFDGEYKIVSYLEEKILKKEGNVTGYQAYVGIYKYETETSLSALKISSIIGKKINFRIGMSAEMCMGDFEGMAIFENSNTATVVNSNEEEACNLIFKFQDNTVTVTEEGCFYWHGANCNFEGVYKRD